MLGQLKTLWKVNWVTVNKKRLSTIFLALGLFFNPFGYDILFATIMHWTNSYWTTVSMFYLLAGLFLGLSIIFSENKPAFLKKTRYLKKRTIKNEQ